MSVQGPRLQNLLFHLLLIALIGLLAWLSHQHRMVFDWTAQSRNSLSPASRELLQSLTGEIEMEVFLGPRPEPREALRRLVDAYRQHHDRLELKLVDPQTQPARVRELGIRGEGEMIIRHAGREERLQQISEHTISNALRRLARGRDRWLGFIEGHGERNPGSAANHDLGQFAARLESRGLRPRLINLISTPRVPDNLDALVIASPQSAYLPGEIAMIRQHLRDGGNLLILLEPDNTGLLQDLLDELGVQPQPGVVVDATTRRFNIDNPAFALVSDYPAERVTPGFNGVSLLPQASALEAREHGDWRYWPLLRTGLDSWTETGPIEGEISYDAAAGELRGPLQLGLALTREHRQGEQRVIVIGDGDFLANAYLGNGANLELGLALAEWLAGDGDSIDTGTTTLDREINIPEPALLGLALVALLGLPLALLLTGLWIWRRRRRH